MKDAKYWIEKLEMLPHPEGGYFKETYRSSEIINEKHLPERFTGDRNISTSIYYLLQNEDCSKLHRIKSDEMWHFYDGSGLIIYEINNQGILIENKLGLDFNTNESPQIVIKDGNWFGAKVIKPNSFCLAGCTVSPGFDFADFEFGNREKLLSEFPEHKEIILQLT